MSTTYTKLMAATGVTACLGVALLPLGSTTASTTADVTVNAAVEKIISISVTVPETVEVTAGGDSTTSSSTITVATNSPSGYTLSLADTDGDNNLASGGNYIPPVSSNNPVAKGNSAWGLQGDSNTVAAYNAGVVAVPTSSQTLRTYGQNTTSSSTVVTYHFSAGVQQPSGTYTDSITYTASAN